MTTKELPAPPRISAIVVTLGIYELQISNSRMTINSVGPRDGRHALFSANHEEAEQILQLVAYGKATIEDMQREKATGH